MPKPTGNGWVNSTVTAVVTSIVILAASYPMMRSRMDKIELQHIEMLHMESQHAEIINRLRILEAQQIVMLRRLDVFEHPVAPAP